METPEYPCLHEECVFVAAVLPGPSLWSRVRQRQVFKGQGGFRPDLRGQGYRGIVGKRKETG